MNCPPADSLTEGAQEGLPSNKTGVSSLSSGNAAGQLNSLEKVLLESEKVNQMDEILLNARAAVMSTVVAEDGISVVN